MKILVTGAPGFVGKNLVARLLQEQHSVLALNSRLGNQYGVLTEVQSFNPDIIYHCAANRAISTSINPTKDIQTNIEGTWNLLYALKDCDYQLFVNLGSSSEYGCKFNAMSEEDVLVPNSYHSFAKAAQTNLVQTHGFVENKPVVTLRLFSVYGPHERSTRLIPAVVDACLNRKDLKLSSPDVVRDFVYVDDVIDVCVKIEELKKHTGQIFNVGTGRQTSIKQVVDIVSKEIGYKPKCLWNEDQRSWDTNRWVANTSKTEQQIGWKSTIDIETGLKKTIEWTKKYGK